MAIHKSDYDRIMKNIDVVAKRHFDNGNFKLGFKTLALAVQDAWISSGECRWENRRKRFNNRVTQANFEANVTATINAL